MEKRNFTLNFPFSETEATIVVLMLCTAILCQLDNPVLLIQGAAIYAWVDFQ